MSVHAHQQHREQRPLIFAPLLILLISASPDEEGRGAPGTTPEQALEMRGASRLRLGLGGAVLFGLSSYSPALGLGFSGDLGVVFADRLSLFIHLEGGSDVLTLIGSGGIAAEYALGDHFTAGLGVSFTAWAPLIYGSSSLYYGINFPLRINFAPSARTGQTARTGLLLGLQVAPGVSLQPTNFYQAQSPLPPEPSIAATLSVGYASW